MPCITLERLKLEDDAESSNEDESSQSELEEPKGKKIRKKLSVKEDMVKDARNKVLVVPKLDPVVQSNMEDLEERFK